MKSRAKSESLITPNINQKYFNMPQKKEPLPVESKKSTPEFNKRTEVAPVEPEREKIIKEYFNKDVRYGKENARKERLDVIRIRISKDRRLINHLDKDLTNNNLLFYDFNSF